MPGEIWDISEISWVYRRGINNQQQPTIWLLALVLIVPKIAECVNFHAGHDCSTPVKPLLPAFQGSSNHHNHSWSIDLDTPHQPSPKKITHFWEMLFPPSNIALWLAPNYSGKRPWLRKPHGPPPKFPWELQQSPVVDLVEVGSHYIPLININYLKFTIHKPLTTSHLPFTSHGLWREPIRPARSSKACVDSVEPGQRTWPLFVRWFTHDTWWGDLVWSIYLW